MILDEKELVTLKTNLIGTIFSQLFAAPNMHPTEVEKLVDLSVDCADLILKRTVGHNYLRPTKKNLAS